MRLVRPSPRRLLRTGQCFAGPSRCAVQPHVLAAIRGCPEAVTFSLNVNASCAALRA
jgi:hypothetical protein